MNLQNQKVIEILIHLKDKKIIDNGTETYIR
jgi:hypothetical protein